jgi:hypothetical protein
MNNVNTNETTVLFPPKNKREAKERKRALVEELHKLKITSFKSSTSTSESESSYEESGDEGHYDKPSFATTGFEQRPDHTRVYKPHASGEPTWPAHGKSCECCEHERNCTSLILWKGLYYFPSESFLAFRRDHRAFKHKNHRLRKHPSRASMCTDVPSGEKPQT